MPRPVFLGCCFAVSLAALSAALTGCASRVQTINSSGEKKVVSETEYKTIYRTGSNLPVRVPVSDTARPLPGAEEVSTLTPEAFRELVNRGGNSRRH